jgi:hypothetical protein
MKKAIIISGSVILAIVVLFFTLYFVSTAPKNAGDFSVDKFTEYIESEHFQTDKNYGNITDYKSAAAAGKTAITERFENSEGSLFEWMGCSLQYDAENDAYYIRTFHINPLVMGGAYDVIIQSDGTVLAIWGEK